LSDAGSKLIRDFGIFNTIPADHPMMYGIPWPGDYLLARCVTSCSCPTMRVSAVGLTGLAAAFQ
jgi:hypothetical protein